MRQFFWLLGLVALPLLAGDKTRILEDLGPYSYEVDYFSEESFRTLTYDQGLVERTLLEPGYQSIYQRYLAYGVKAQLESSRAPSSEAREFTQQRFVYPVPQHLGIIAFKRGELSATCPKVVAAAKALGSQTIAYYHPVHFSGGNSKSYKMPKHPTYGKHWRFETTLHFSQAEFEACLDLIDREKLRLHYVPHLEGVKAMVDAGTEEDWRLVSGIPIDDHYFHHGFGPLLTYLTKKPRAFTSGPLLLTLAAELDPMVFSYARKVRAGQAWLEAELKRLARPPAQFYLNTNGDFFHGKDLTAERGHDCAELKRLLAGLHGLTPSMYGDKGHFEKTEGGHLSLPKTLEAYRARFRERLRELCPKAPDVNEVIDSKPLGFGEFALDPETQSYGDVLKDAKDLLFVQYWTHGRWDHLGVLEAGSARARRELLKESKPPQGKSRP